MTTCCYIGLGSNLNNPGQQIRMAIGVLKAEADLQVDAISPFYRSAAVGPGEQPDYCNAVVAIRTELTPRALLLLLQDIEKSQGRDRENSVRWGARTLDLDILLYGNDAINETDLVIPHAEIKNRNFVLKPLFDIAPGLKVPGLGDVSTMLQNVGEAGLRLWDGAEG